MEPVSTPAISPNPPSGGVGLGGLPAPATPAPATPPVAPPAAPVAPAAPATFAQMLASEIANPTTPAPIAPAAAATPPSPATPAAGAPATPATLEQLQAELAALKASQLPPDQMEQLRQFANYGQQAWREAQLRQQAPPGTPTPPAPATPSALTPHPITGVIPFSDAEKAMLTVDANGVVTAMPGAPADIVQRWHMHQRSQGEFLRRLASDPDAALGKLLEAKATEIAAKQIQQAAQQQAQQSDATRIAETNKAWVFQNDASGQPKRDAMGNPVLTENGQFYIGVLEKLHAAGVKDPVLMDQLGRQTLLGHLAEKQILARQQPAPTAPAPVAPAPVAPGAPAAPVGPAALGVKTPEQIDAEVKSMLLARAANNAAATPLSLAINPPAAPTSKGLSFREMYQADAQAMGIR